MNSATGFRDRVVELRRVRAGDLRANPKNWRTHPARQREALRALLSEIGFADALLAREAGGELILVDGHLRKDLDQDQVVPVLVLDLSEGESDLLLASLDPFASLAGANSEKVAALHAAVKTQSDAVRRLLADVARASRVSPAAGAIDPDEIPVPVPRCKPGHLWQVGSHRIFCGDARSSEDLARLMSGEKADVLWTDPPFGNAYQGKTSRAMTIQNDDSAGLRDLLGRSFEAVDAVLRSGAAIYIVHPAGPLSVTFSASFLGAGWRIKQGLVWAKDSLVLGHSDYHYRHEPILYGEKPGTKGRGRGRDGWYGGNAETSIFDVERPKASRDHPTAKPVELVRRCLQNSSAMNDVVLDPFLGGGTTLVAAEQLGRRCYGIEIDPEYADVAIARIEAFSGNKAVRI